MTTDAIKRFNQHEMHMSLAKHDILFHSKLFISSSAHENDNEIMV